MDTDLFVSILTVTMQAGASLVFAAIGEIFTERSGVLNLGLEGIMIMGALSAFAAAFHSQSLIVALLAAMLVGALLASIHALLCVSLRADQVVTGLALTLFGVGLSSFLGERVGPDGATLVGRVGPRFLPVELPLLSKIPYLGESLFTQDPMVYAMYLLVPLAWYYIYKTRPGLHLRAVGENPATADSLGISVPRTRYFYTILGGALIGLGGAHFSLAYAPGWAENLTAGRGWIAIALVIFATWNPLRAVVGAVLFGGVNAIQFRLQAEGTTIPPAFMNMWPYLLTIVVLVIITWWDAFGKRMGAPAALGSSYVREERG
jgi:simple sugar transport system permease protein